MKKIKIISVVGARPNFMKIAPILREFKLHKSIHNTLVHTGQHYDKNMSNIFLKNLNIPKPKINLHVGSKSHASQTAEIMIQFESIIKNIKPDLVIVVGDVNSTIACSIVTKKLNTKIAHIEAGLRSFDFNMPEEINRILTDSISDLLFTTSINANSNLIKEGIDRNKIYFVGNCMIDTLKYQLNEMNLTLNKDKINHNYAVLTLHRPSNVDNKVILKKLLNDISKISDKIPIIFPIHPRTLKQINIFKLNKLLTKNIIIKPPLSYLNFLRLYKNARFILTDSGGIQEESSFLNIPCITLRENTERPITITHGTNILVGTKSSKIHSSVSLILNNKFKKKKQLKYWDGNASKRIVKIIKEKI